MSASQLQLEIALGFFSILFGSIPFGVLIAKIYQRDITQHGSGNIGATNVSRVLGFWPAGVITFVLDFLKGVVPPLLVRPEVTPLWLPWVGATGAEFSLTLAWFLGFLSVLGHCFSPWIRFRGGKGVATGFGVVATLSPAAAVLGVVAFVLTFLNKRTGSLSSLAGLTAAVTTHLVLQPLGNYVIFAGSLAFLIVLRHENNIDALLDQREKTF